MGLPANSLTTYDAVGIREDLLDRIYNVDPDATPFMTGSGRTGAKQTKHEWQTDELDAADTTNAVLEGDDATTDAPTVTARIGNITQISDKVARVTGTQEAVDKAGRVREMSYQVAVKTRELKRDCEAILLNNQSAAIGDNSTARNLGGLPAWVRTNINAAGDATDPPLSAGLPVARTDGTPRALTESILKGVSQSLFTESGTGPNMTLLVPPQQKVNLTSFTGTNTTKYQMADDRRLTDSVDFYTSDFHEFKVVPDRFMRTSEIFLWNPEYTAVAYLRPYRQWPLAKTGDTERRQVLVEYTLRVGNEKALGAGYDLS